MPAPVKLQLVGLDGNAFSLMGAFKREARKQGWVKEDIDKVMEECQSGDYNHLLATLSDNCVDPDEDDEDEDYHCDDDDDRSEDEDGQWENEEDDE